MEEKTGLINFIKKFIKKEMKNNNIGIKDEVFDETHNLNDNIEIQSVDIFDIKETIQEEIMQPEEPINEKIRVEDSENSDNLYIERVADNMFDIKRDIVSPCEITNNLKQAVLKIQKNLITEEQLANLGVSINLGHIDEYQVLDVAFKYTYEIDNPCGGKIPAEALLKAVVLVGSVHYSWLLYDKTTEKVVYDGAADSVTAYSIYDIVQFDDQDVRPTNVTAKFTPGPLTKLDVVNDPDLDFHLFTVNGTVDIVAI